MRKAVNNQKVNVVIVENDPTYLKMWEKIFKDLPDCKYMITNDPASATNLIRTQPIDLVISEIIFPDTDGYTIAEFTHKHHPCAEILLTTAYDCDLSRFNLKNPHFSILYKPYNNIADIQKFIRHLVHHEDVFSDASEDSFSENESYPEVMEWKL
jgi:DNA-binding NtrC family response regulator